MSKVYIWSDGQLVPHSTMEPGLIIELADSWRVSDGLVRAEWLHRRRFTDDPIALVGGNADELAEFWNAVTMVIPDSGEWFPRVELVRTNDGLTQLIARVRPAPTRRASAVVATAQGSDVRSDPSRKGPDLLTLLDIRAAAAAAPADEAILLTEQGYVVDGATSAVMWWRGGELAKPPAEFARVDSVTARLVEDIAAQCGIAVTEDAARSEDLEGAEVWILNALHGVRLVKGWIEGPRLAEDSGRAAEWENALRQFENPVR